MSDGSHLPDDPRDWPRGSYELLGVPEAVDRKQLRRAYHALLKRFKPEQAPEQFRLVREAYDQILRHVEFREQYGISIRGGDDADDNASTASHEEAASAATTNGDAPTWPSAPAIEDPASVWRTGVDGDLTKLYLRLTKFVDQRSDDAELYARLYWLKLLAPEVDTAREANDWLVTGLCRVGPAANQLVELYRRALEQSADEALRPRAERLFQVQPVPSWLPTLAAVVWCKARLAGQVERIIDTYTACRSRLGTFGERGLHWQLSSMAVRELWLAHDPRDGASSELRNRPAGKMWREILTELETDFGADPQYYDLLAWLDERRAFSQAWHGARGTMLVRAELLDLLLLAEAGDRGQWRPALLNYLASEEPSRLYIQISSLGVESQLLLHQFGNLVDSVEAYSPDIEQVDWPAELLRRLLVELCDDEPVRADSRESSLRLLQFCLDNCLSPAQLIEHFTQDEDFWSNSGYVLPAAAAGNAPLDITYRAFRLLLG
ncbi:MAG: J domain-containing protein [Planctomycetes bacterium]|nr:J domain-containing protein [Planctomycetota bacterium]